MKMETLSVDPDLELGSRDFFWPVTQDQEQNSEKFHPFDMKTILITLIQPKITLFIDVLASCWKPSSGMLFWLY